MGGGQHVGLGTEDMIGGEWVAFSWAFAADVAVGRGLSYESSTFWVVAAVVGSAGVPDCFTLAGTDRAASRLGGESTTFDAGSADRHGLMLGTA